MDPRMEALKNAAQVKERNEEPATETGDWATFPAELELARVSDREVSGSSRIPENGGDDSIHSAVSASLHLEGPILIEENAQPSSSNTHDAEDATEFLTAVPEHRRWNARTLFPPETLAPSVQQLLLFSLSGAVMFAMVVAFYLFASSFDDDELPVPPTAQVGAEPTSSEPNELSSADPSLSPAPESGTTDDSDEKTPTKGEEGARLTSLEIKKGHISPRRDQLVSAAYEAYRRGEFAAAHDVYWKALRVDPNSRNALLGLAAISVRNGDVAQAREFYFRLLERDPDDPLALTGLLNLQAPTGRRAAESQIKSLLTRYPRAAHLHAALGDLYAAEGRWPEARSSYEKAFALDEREALAPEQKNPDFAFNLAVSLEHLGQHSAALRQYRAALALAAKRKPLFDLATAKARIDALASKGEK